MHKHDWFDLWLHDDDELAAHLNSAIVQRETIHQWPLSSVDRLVTADRRTWIYKTQYGPTVEADFYARAQSPLLVPARTIQQQDGHLMMLFEYIDAPLIRDLDLNEDEVLRVGREVLCQIAEIAGDTPHWLDVSTAAKWREVLIWTCDTLRTLVADGQLTRFDTTHVTRLRQIGLAPALLTAVEADTGYVHSDLTADNLFILPDGNYRLIDWARPLLGPPLLDLATLLESLGVDPLRHVDRPIVIMMALLRIHWLVQCAIKWIPEGIQSYDEQIAALMQQIEHAG